MRVLQGIVFDFDGVIANSEPLHLQAFQQSLREEGIELTRAEYFSRYLGFDDIGLIEALARDRGLEMSSRRATALVAAKGVKLQEMMRTDGILFPGAAAFIRTAAAEVPIAIASGALRHEIDEILDAAGLSPLFRAIVASGDTPESKPSPAPYRLAFTHLQASAGPLDPGRCVAIEDSRWGLDSARGAGLRCVAVTNSYSARELPGAELVIAGLNELTLDALDRLCQQTPGTL